MPLFWLILQLVAFKYAHALLGRRAQLAFHKQLSLRIHSSIRRPPPSAQSLTHANAVGRSCLLRMSSESLERRWPRGDVDDIENVYVISDLHTDNLENLEWLKERCTNFNSQQTPRLNDALIIAGDISHELSKLEETLSIIIENLSCHVFFIWGNHEAWVGGQEMDSLGIETSLQKIEAVKKLCEQMGVYTDFQLVGKSNENPVFILPIESWYDATLSLQGCEDLCVKFNAWPWVDFLRCEWPDQNTLKQWCLLEENTSFSIDDGSVQNTGRIPLGLAEWFALKNTESISKIQDIYCNLIQVEQGAGETMEEKSRRPPGLITFSHFLPNQKTLPDWKDPNCETFLRDEWLDHPVPDVSAKFAKVSGSALIDKQIRSILSSISESSDLLESVQHLHVFGHSHRPKDFVYEGIRYVHNPLGKPVEREMNMVSNATDFQLVWDCTKSSRTERDVSDDDNVSYSGGIGEIPGVRVIRFWEEKGGGKGVLARKMKHRRLRRRIEVKRLVRDVKRESKS